MLKIEIIDDLNSHSDQEKCKDVYNVWYDTWIKEFREIDPNAKLYSDNFTRQDKILGLFIDNKCAGLTFFNTVNLNHEYWRKDSYFADWPCEVLDDLCEKNDSEILVCSAYTVKEEFRKRRVLRSIVVADILAVASLDYFRSSQHTTMVGNMRNSKGANKIVYKFGADLLSTVKCHNELSDLVKFQKEKLPEFPRKIQQLIDDAKSENDLSKFKAA